MLARLLTALLLSLALLPAVEVLNVPGATELREPFSIAFDSHGQLFGVEFTPHNRVFTIRGGKLEFISGVKWDSKGNGKGQVPAPAQALDLKPAVYNGIHDIAIGADDAIYLGDTFQHRICRLDPKTFETTILAGTGQPGFSGDGGAATQAKFNGTFCNALTPDGHALIVADMGNARVRRINLSTHQVETIAGNGKKGLPKDGGAALTSPLIGVRATCVARDGTVYILLRDGHALAALKDGKLHLVVNKTGKSGIAGDGGPAIDAQMNGPKYICMDAKQRVLILDTENSALRLYDPVSGLLTTVAGKLGQTGNAIGKEWSDVRLKRPHGARIGPDGRLYLVDTENHRILIGSAP